MGLEAEGLPELCRIAAGRLGVVFDLHGDFASYTSEGDQGRIRPGATGVAPRRITGAGDVWDAGAIYGRLKGMDERDRLDFANGRRGSTCRTRSPSPLRWKKCCAQEPSYFSSILENVQETVLSISLSRALSP